ncbi:MAG: LytTR family DNA-binding domain-containing protein [Cytophagales bacterium]|nr:LytTR family DNA-binding domain-containing protein [Cytophagales bacterium]
MKIKCLIIDDEPLAINILKNYLARFEGFEIAGTYGNAVEAFNNSGECPADLLFLDINMPMLNGMEFLKGLNAPPLTIITTAYREYAVESFELNVIDYLVKPISFSRFIKAINKAKHLLKTDAPYNEKNGNGNGNDTDNIQRSIFIKVNKKMIRLAFNDILYIESLKDYVRIKTLHEDFITHENLAGMSKLLPSEQFLRIHRSFTINLMKVKSIEGNCVEISGKLLPIGRNYQKHTKQLILDSCCC